MAGGQATNDQAVQFEEQQAAQQQQQEAQRQQRLNQGMDAINKVFDGSPVMGTKTTNYDWSQFNPTATTPTTDPITGQTTYTQGSGIPAGYTAVQVPSKNADGTTGAGTWTFGGQTFQRPTSYTTGSVDSPMTYDTSQGADGTGNTEWALQDAQGNITRQGDPLSITSTYDTGQKTGGFDQAYYDNYRQQYLNLYQPDEARQYEEAQRDLGYSLANSGITRSSMAADKQGELAYNDQLEKAKIVSDASNAEQGLRNTVESEKQSVINQLYSTEDPSLAASLSQNSANAINLQTPTFTPGAQLFGAALTTVGSGVQAATSPYSLISPYGAMYPGGQQGSVASAGTSTGKGYS